MIGDKKMKNGKKTSLTVRIIAGAALDVFTIEPVKKDNPLLHIKNKENLVLTPHIAWASEEARNRLFSEVIKNIDSYYNGENKNRIV